MHWRELWYLLGPSSLPRTQDRRLRPSSTYPRQGLRCLSGLEPGPLEPLWICRANWHSVPRHDSLLLVSRPLAGSQVRCGHYASWLHPSTTQDYQSGSCPWPPRELPGRDGATHTGRNVCSTGVRSVREPFKFCLCESDPWRAVRLRQATVRHLHEVVPLVWTTRCRLRLACRRSAAWRCPWLALCVPSLPNGAPLPAFISTVWWALLGRRCWIPPRLRLPPILPRSPRMRRALRIVFFRKKSNI